MKIWSSRAQGPYNTIVSKTICFSGIPSNCFEHENKTFQRHRVLKTRLFQNLRFFMVCKNTCFEHENKIFQKHKVLKARSFQNLGIFIFVQNNCFEHENRTFQGRRVVKTRSFQNLRFFCMVLRTNTFF